MNFEQVRNVKQMRRLQGVRDEPESKGVSKKSWSWSWSWRMSVGRSANDVKKGRAERRKRLTNIGQDDSAERRAIRA